MRTAIVFIATAAIAGCGSSDDKPSDRGAAKGRAQPSRSEFDDARRPAFLFGGSDKRACYDCTPRVPSLQLTSASGATERAAKALSASINPSFTNGLAVVEGGVAHFNLQIPWESTATFNGTTRPAVPRRQYATSEFEYWRVSVPAPPADAVYARTTLAPGPIGRTEVGRWPITITGPRGSVVEDHVVATTMLGAQDWKPAATGPLVFPGETAATAAGVIDTLEQFPFYQGPPGPLSNARYVAVAAPGPRRYVSCGRYGNSQGSVNVKIEAHDLDVTVRDRFAGTSVASKHFAAVPKCASSFSNDGTPGSGAGEAWVDRAAVRAWVGSVIPP